MSTKNYIQYFFLIVAVCIGAIELVFAVGTPAGTVISTKTKVLYSSASSGYVDSVFSNTVSFTVAQIAGVNISPLTNSLITLSDSTTADFPVTLTNSGNGSDQFLFSSTSSKNWVREIYFDANGDGVLQQSELSSGPITQSQSVAADAEYKIILRVKVPRGELLNGQSDSTSLMAVSQFNSNVKISALYVTTVQTSNLSLSLSVNKATPSPGEDFTYTLVVTNNGSVAANNISVTDLLDTRLDYISNSSSQGSVVSTSNPVVWNVGTLLPGNSATLNITTQVKSGILPNTIINNAMGVAYKVGSNSYTSSSNLISISVGFGAAYDVKIQPMWSALTKEATDTLLYRFRITNAGVVKDVIEISLQSSKNFSWNLYKDANNNGNLDGTDPVLTNSNGSFGVDTDTLAAGDSVRIFARTILQRYPNGTKDSLTITAMSMGKNSVTQNAVVITTVSAEEIVTSMTKFPAGNLPAGEEVTYTVAYSNIGNASVENFSVMNVIPDATDYVVNSVKINGIPGQDNSGPIVISKNEQNKTVISVSLGKLNSKANGTVEYKVVIK